MEQRLHFLTIATPDLNAARAFYRNGLGWEPMIDVPGEIIFFQIAPGLTFGLFEATSFAHDLGNGEAPPAVSGVTLSHNVANTEAVDSTIAALLAAGATLRKPAQQSAFGGIYHGHVADPNGIIWEIAHNPGWHIDAQGDVHLGSPA